MVRFSSREFFHSRISWGSPGGAVGKKLPANAGARVGSLGWEGPWSRKWQPTPAFSPGKSHGQRSLAGYSPQAAKCRPQLSNWSGAREVAMTLSEFNSNSCLMTSFTDRKMERNTSHDQPGQGRKDKHSGVIMAQLEPRPVQSTLGERDVLFWGFHGGSDGKESACNGGDLSSILDWEDPLENGMATHYSIPACRITMDRGAWRATVHRVIKSWMMFYFILCDISKLKCGAIRQKTWKLDAKILSRENYQGNKRHFLKDIWENEGRTMLMQSTYDKLHRKRPLSLAVKELLVP